MTPTTFYRGCLALPLLSPVLLAWQTETASLLALALLMGGPAYLVFALRMYVLIGRRRTLGRIQRLSFLAPLLYLPYLVVGVIVLMLIQGGELTPLSELATVCALMCAYGLLIGYACVGLVSGVALVLELAGWLRDDALEAGV